MSSRAFICRHVICRGDMSETCLCPCRRHGDISVISWLLFQLKHKNSSASLGLCEVWREVTCDISINMENGSIGKKVLLINISGKRIVHPGKPDPRPIQPSLPPDTFSPSCFITWIPSSCSVSPISSHAISSVNGSWSGFSGYRYTPQSKTIHHHVPNGIPYFLPTL